jgi:hypothetical protein
MPLLARAKRRTAAALNSAALHADSRQTSILHLLVRLSARGIVVERCTGLVVGGPRRSLDDGSDHCEGRT